MTSTPFSVMEELESPLWPIHLKPRTNELLSSWMIRLAHAHGYKVERMCRVLFGRDHALWSRDVDRFVPCGVLAKLCQITGTSPEQARLTTLESYGGFLSEEVHPGGHSPWILPLHIHHRQRTAPGLMYCPVCLEGGDTAYYRRAWRLAFVTVCTVHGVVLRDTCWQCRSPVMPHRVDIGRCGATPRDRSFVRCWRCGCKLSAGDVEPCDEYLLAFTRNMEAVLECGFVNLGSRLGLHSVPYFAGVRVLARLAAKEKCLRAASIENLPIDQRQSVMRKVAELLESWPTNFLQAMKAAKTTYSEVVQPRETLPFWLESVAFQLKRHQHPARSEAEVAEIARLITSKQGHLDTATLRRSYGVHVRLEKFPLHCRTAVSHDNHETLMASLEHAAARSFNPKTRFACLQDLIMFSLYRFTDLSAAKICALSLTDMLPLQASPFSADAWWGVPRTRVQAIRALHRHIQGVRRQFDGAQRCSRTFFSPFTGRPLRASGMQARFRQAVVASALTASIPNMAVYKVR